MISYPVLQYPILHMPDEIIRIRQYHITILVAVSAIPGDTLFNERLDTGITGTGEHNPEFIVIPEVLPNVMSPLLWNTELKKIPWAK